MTKAELRVARNVLAVRLRQMIINEMCKKGVFKIPIHLALGHEAIAVAVDAIMEANDKLVLTHRNIHYNLARVRGLKKEVEEYYLNENGLACGRLGSMNLSNSGKNVVYSSSILGNNFAVGSGLALGEKVNIGKGVVIIVTGDGAIEEGSFYESLVFQRSNDLAALIIIENNEWSLATKIAQRRIEVDLRKIAGSVGACYIKLKGNNVFHYVEKLKDLRKIALTAKTTVCVEVELSTLGSRYMETKEYPGGKFINYHAGPAPTVNLSDGPIISRSVKDPVYVLERYLGGNKLKKCADKVLTILSRDIK